LPTDHRRVVEMRKSTALKAAAALLLLLSLAAAYLSIMSYWERRKEEEIHGMFTEYKARCDKTYNSSTGEEYRYAVFKENFRRGYRVSVCIFGDMTAEEVSAWKPGALTLEEELLADQRQQVVFPLVEGGRDGRGGAVSR
jgi:hypothetical protein